MGYNPTFMLLNTAAAASGITFIASGGAAGVASSYTESINLTTSTNGYLVVSYVTDHNSPGSITATYNGASMTKVGPEDFGNHYCTLFVLANPDQGSAHNLVVGNWGGTNAYEISWAFYSNATQTTPPLIQGNGGYSSPSAPVVSTLTTTILNSWMIGVFCDTSGPASVDTAGANTVIRNQNVANDRGVLADSGAALSVGSHALTISSPNGNVNWRAYSMVLEPSIPLQYSFSKTITIDHTKVGGSTLTNFPVGVIGTYTYLKTVGNGGSVQNANGYDIIFTSDASGATRLDFEIDTYNATTGAVAFWVRVPSISSSVDTAIYMWYGNSSITTTQANPTGVWDSNFVGVYHLGDGTTLSVADSTGLHNGTNHGATAAAGQISGGASFNGTTAYISLGTFTNLGSSPLTMSIWYNYNVSQDNFIFCFPADDSGSDDKYGTIRVRSDSGVTGVAGFSNSPYNAYENFTSTINTWQKVDVIITGGGFGGTTTVYLNGSLVGTSGGNTGNNAPTSPIGYLGRLNATYGFYTAGVLDEARVSKVNRAAGWLTAEYNNQSSPSTFYTVT